MQDKDTLFLSYIGERKKQIGTQLSQLRYWTCESKPKSLKWTEDQIVSAGLTAVPLGSEISGLEPQTSSPEPQTPTLCSRPTTATAPSNGNRLGGITPDLLLQLLRPKFVLLDLPGHAPRPILDSISYSAIRGLLDTAAGVIGPAHGFLVQRN